jgi:hypothetical protein
MGDDGHRWKFFRSGGVDQVVFRSGADIVNLRDLDQKLWVALACPTRGLEFDSRTLELIDDDKDGRVRVGEVLRAAEWIPQVFKNPDDLIKGGDSVPLSAINDQTEAGKALLAGAKRVLTNLGKASATAIALGDVLDLTKIFAETKFNGDGVIVPGSASDDATRKAIEDIIATVGSVTDRSGKPGVNKELTEKFFSEAKAYCDWQAKGESDKNVLPLGAATATAAGALRAVKAKVDDYFARCRLAAFDPRAAGPMNGDETVYTVLAKKDLTASVEEVAGFPLARVEPGKDLSLSQGVNPAWTGALATLASAAAKPLLGKEGGTLSESEWESLKAKLAAHESWMAGKPSSAVEKLGLPRLRALVGSKAKESIFNLIQQDAALEKESTQIESLEKLVRFQRDFHRLLCNLVNFSDFYSRKGSTFQAGTLYLDGRSCDLCFRVEDSAKHAALAGLAKTYLAYCDCTRPATGEKMSIAAAFTNGDSDNLMAGRNGVFYDRKGLDWDATITRIVENPISIRQAFWKPYKSFLRMIEEQVAKRAAAAEAESAKKVEAGATAVATADQTQAGAKPAAKKIDVGTVAAIGVAVAGLATFMSTILGLFFGLGPWIPIGIVGIILAISGPSVLIAWLKLRQRNLGPILDANGWAVNGRVKVNVPFGGALTGIAALPPGSERSLTDPYAPKKRRWPMVVFILAVLLAIAGLWGFGKLDGMLPEQITSTSVLRDYATTAAKKAAVERAAAAKEAAAKEAAEKAAAEKAAADKAAAEKAAAKPPAEKP